MAANTKTVKGQAYWAKVILPDKEYQTFNIEILLDKAKQEEFKVMIQAEIDKKVEMHTEGKKKPSKKVTPTRTATRPKAQPKPVRNPGGMRLEDASKDLITSGSRGSLPHWVAANREKNK